jgi:ATP-dependent DNA ligase
MMEIYKDRLTKRSGYEEGTAEAVAEELSAKAINYKQEVTKSYISISPEQINDRLGGMEFFVTRKYDGELNLIFFDGDNVFVLNRSGRVRLGLPCVEEAGKALSAAGIRQAVIPSELYVNEEKGRTRVFDVLESLADEKLVKNLCIAPFDIYEIDNDVNRAMSYGETYRRLNEIFGKTEMCRPVTMQKAASKTEVKEIYRKWVDDEGSEGLVVRSELPLVYKIKPRYTVDVAVVGFSEGTGDQKGQIRSLLLAMMPEEGQYQIIGRTGNGFDEELKKQLFADLSPKIIKSLYIETDSNHVAFHMINPELVIELMVNDVLFETSSGAIINPVLEIVDEQYIRRGSLNGISFVYPIFVRFRDDKKVCLDDVRLSQINSFSYIPSDEIKKDAELPKSQIIHREVYKKETGEKLMVQKFVVWKTGKEKKAEYPAYVFHYTNFSSDRKEPLQRDVFVSDNEEQIMQLMQNVVDKNIKKGWEIV